jgi:hypothetical protein
VKILCSADCLKSTIAESTYFFDPNSSSIENLHIPQLQIYPTPTKGKVVIECEDIIDEIRLFNISGYVLLQQSPNERNIQISMDNYPTGVYLLHIVTGGKNIIRKIVKT